MGRRPTALVFLCFASLLVLTPLVLKKPGWPAGLKSDEPAYYLMALSLAHDGDLRCDVEDIQRLFAEFPFHEVHNLILATDDGWNTVYFGKPYIYSLFAAPAAGLFGASGIVAFNMVLMLFMVWLGARYLERYNPPWLALLFSFGFFFLSCSYSYIFWLHPEIWNMAAVMVSLYLGLTDRLSTVGGGRGGATARMKGWLASPVVRAAGAGGALMLAVYNKPMMLAFCLPVLYRGLVHRRLGTLVGWGVGAALSGLLTVGGAMALMGHPSAYLMARGGQKVCADDEMPIKPAPPPPLSAEAVAEVVTEVVASSDSAEFSSVPRSAAEAEEAPHKPPEASWYWLLRIPRPHPAMVVENLQYFLWGRHTGLFLYFPFSLLALGLFLFHGRQRKSGWVTLLALATVALYFLLWIPFNYQGGGGFVGNRYFVNAYPAFLFLVTRIAPQSINLLGYLLGGLLLGPTLLSPFGRSVPAPTLQAHVRNFPFSAFPLELSLREIPGYESRIWSGAFVRGRKDVFLPRGARFWTHGATTTEVWIQTEERLESLFFEVLSLATPNTVTLRLKGTEVRLDFAQDPGGAQPARQRVELTPSGPSQVRRVEDGWVYVYRLEVEAAGGAGRTWKRNFPPQDCFTFAYNETIEESFFVGAEMAYLGSKKRLELDIYEVDWGAEMAVPEQVSAGEVFTLQTQVTNRSPYPWPSSLPTRVALSYRWKTLAGEVVVANGLRTYLGHPAPSGAVLTLPQDVAAPETPGQYVLELDLVYELVAWFSWHNGENVFTAQVEVLPKPAAPSAAEESASSSD